MRTHFHLMTSASGVATPDAAVSRPVNLLMSGPVAGVVGGLRHGPDAVRVWALRALVLPVLLAAVVVVIVGGSVWMARIPPGVVRYLLWALLGGCAMGGAGLVLLLLRAGSRSGRG